MESPASIASTGGAAGRANLDAFDALLAPAPPAASTQNVAPGAAGSSAAPSAATSSQVAPPPRIETAHEPPRFQEFVSGWPLYRDPILCAVVAGAALGSLGVFVVLRRAVFVTATLSQAAGLGVALAFYLQIHHGLDVSPVAGALFMSAAATLLVGARPPGKMSRETLVGMAFVTTSALAVLVGDRIAQEAHDIAAVLFGTAVLVRPIDLQLVIGGGLLTLGALYTIARPLTFSGFDPEGARIQGLPVRAIEVSFWLIFAVVVSVSTRALGSLPVFALAVLPAAAGLAIGERVGVAVAIAALGGALSGGLGYMAAFLVELPVGASQSACAAALAVLVYVLVHLVRRPRAATS